MNVDDIRSDTLHAQYDELDQIVPLLNQSGFDDAHLSAHRVVIETENTKLEFTAEGDSVEIREIE